METGEADAMISFRSNFFYSRSGSCELWFFINAICNDLIYSR